jgi:hypothetical protein
MRSAVVVSTLAALVASRAGRAVAEPLPMSSPAEYDDRPISAAAGEEYFMHTGGGDPYAAGLAYPVFRALMDAFPEELGADWPALAARFGLDLDPDPRQPPIGLHLTTDPNTGVPWVVGNCRFCHSARLRLPGGDVVVPGLGSRRVRPHAYAEAFLRIGADPRLSPALLAPFAARRAAEAGIPWSPALASAITEASVAGLRALAARRGAAGARLAVAAPGRVATIESFAIVLGEALGRAIHLPDAIGWTKIPDVRGFPFRDTFSYDASGYGSPQALVLEADFVAGTRPEWYLAHPHLATSMYLFLRSFRRKLPYPRPVDRALAGRGHAIFEDNCAGCHGHYLEDGGEMRVSYRERVIPLEDVGTDPARAEAVTQDYVDAANAYPLTRGLARVRHTGGYVPPVLLDVWARGCYGHAGQWPSLAVLARPPSERPRSFIVDPDAPYDLDEVGEHHTPDDGRKLRAGEYRVTGISVLGHPFLAELPPEKRTAVIEYLKTL